MRIGVFGGTFDPPHSGHVAVAKAARESLDLDRVLFVPARCSPFKVGEEGVTDPALRLEMVRAAVADEPGLEVDRLELDRPSPSWTVDTLRELLRRAPEAELVLLLGVDQWSSFGRWREAEEIVRLATIAVMSRDGVDPAGVDPGLPPGVEVDRVPVEVPRVDLSSSEIRERVGAGETVASLLPPGVGELIDAHALYRATPGGARQRTVPTC